MTTDLYKNAGVDVEKGDELVDWLQTDASSTKNRYAELVSGIGGFAGLVRPHFKGMKDPLLVTSTDGVGTKVLLGIEYNMLEGLGQDLVAMCVNDLYTVGGYPMFFLDYYATGSLEGRQFKEVLTGIKRALKPTNAYLLGGETAELPGLYAKHHFDLAGFVVGVVDGAAQLGPARVKVGDALVAFGSNGFHSNGYSLIRKWIGGKTVSEYLSRQLLTPTKVYWEVPELLEAMGTHRIHALANITGGGISGNLPRVMPKNTRAVIHEAKVPTPDWMQEFWRDNGATFHDVENIFNCGAGMIAIVADEDRHTVVGYANKLGLDAHIIGQVEAFEGEAEVVYSKV